MCFIICEDSSQRPVWTATMLMVVEEPLIRPTEDILCPFCCSTCPFICTENTSGSELMPTRCRLTGAYVHILTSKMKEQFRYVGRQAGKGWAYWPGKDPSVNPLIVYLMWSTEAGPFCLNLLSFSLKTPNKNTYSWWMSICLPDSSRLPADIVEEQCSDLSWSRTHPTELKTVLHLTRFANE